MPRILIALPHLAPSLMTDEPEVEQFTGNQPRLNASRPGGGATMRLRQRI